MMSLFNKKTEHKEEVQVANLSNTIGKGTVITGDIESYGNIRIEGKVIGNIQSKSKIVLGDGCVVEGNISAQNAEIEGSVKGTLEIKDILNLKATATIDGDIHTAKLVTDPGARFNGKCHMIGESKGSPKQLNGGNQEALPKGGANKNGANANAKKATANV